ncbi:MAG TPA: glycosyltransferase [Micromonosporaceae bacterium]|nr:glycosyltransferase [Micromonosporaceae bacterium]
MRVLHIITGLAAGGAEQQLRLLLRHQPGAEVATLTNPGSVARAIRSEGTVVHDIGMRGNTDAFALPRLVRLMRARRFDLVHTHLYRACLYGRVAARLAGVRPVVATEHSLGDQHIEGRRITPGIRRLYLATERLGSTTIAVSAAVVRRLVAWGVPESRVELIPNGIEADRYRFDPARRARVRAQLGIAPGRFVVGSVGRLVSGKNIDVMLRALRGQAAVTALVLGEGPERPALTTLARELRVDAVFTGESADVPGYLSAMDVLVAPSTEETFGLAVMEALAAGLAVFYGACPALDDLPPGSAPGAHRLPTDVDGVRRVLGAAVQEGPRRLPPPPVLDRYDLARIAGRTNAVYRRVAGVTSHKQSTLLTEEG